MCGLFGIAGPGITTWDLDVLKDLAIVSTLRGTDSSGILQADVNTFGNSVKSEYFIEKAAHGMEYFKWFHEHGKGGNRKVFKGATNNIFAGHVRAATKGFIIDSNAHPFDINNTVGMHNGTLIEHKFQHKKKTDSEILIRAIDEDGLAPTLSKITNPYSAYALVLWNKGTGKLTFVRNKERPLFFCYSAVRDVIYWASEDWMLRGIMKRQRERINQEAVYFFKEDHSYTIDPCRFMKKNPEQDFEITKINKSYDHIYGRRYGGFDWHGWADNQEEKAPVPLLPAPKNDDKLKGNILKFERDAKIPKFECCGCHKEMNLVQVHFGTKLSNNTVVCEDCQKIIPFDVKPEEVIIN